MTGPHRGSQQLMSQHTIHSGFKSHRCWNLHPMLPQKGIAPAAEASIVPRLISGMSLCFLRSALGLCRQSNAFMNISVAFPGTCYGIKVMYVLEFCTIHCLRRLPCMQFLGRFPNSSPGQPLRRATCGQFL